jgi:hypothetical protein
MKRPVAARLNYRLLPLLGLALSGCGTQGVKAPVSANEAIEIARQHVQLNALHHYTPSAYFDDGMWVVKFESDSGFVGDFVYCYVAADGRVREVRGGY